MIGEIPEQTIPDYLPYPTNPIPKLQIVLDNIRSALNVGSIFRSADGAGVTCLHLCGVTPTPENAGVKKTALGAEKNIPWVYHPDGVEAVVQLKTSGNMIWALEGGVRTTPLMAEAVPSSDFMVLVVGSELGGVDPGIIDLCDSVVYLPMVGSKGSLNVAVACGIAIYWLRFLSASANGTIASQ